MSTITPETWTIRRLLEWTTAFFGRKTVDAPRLSAELLLSHVLTLPRIALYTQYERILKEAELAAFKSLMQRAAEHEPIAYLTGRAYFFNLEFEITRDVLIPRPDTETLVENAITLCRNTAGFESPRILDLCTGSGCIAIALAKNLPAAQIVAADISEKALAVAGRNVERHALSNRITLAQGDLYAALADLVDPSPFHIIVANPPYIASAKISTLDRNVRDYEPRQALDGGTSGLEIIQRILVDAPKRLLPQGRVFIEIAYDQGDAAKQLLIDAGFIETKGAAR